MKKLLISSVVGLAFWSCQKPYIFNRVVTQKGGEKMLYGGVDRMAFEQPPFFDWFFLEYDAYKPEPELVKKIKKKKGPYRVEIFMGTWDENSREWYPRFLKVMDNAKFSENRTVTYAVNTSLQSFYGEEIGKNITHLPTFIFYRGPHEVGRIVGSPVSGLMEEDILMIENRTPFTPKYSDR